MVLRLHLDNLIAIRFVYVLNYQHNGVILYITFRVCLVRIYTCSASIARWDRNDNYHSVIMIPFSQVEPHNIYNREVVQIINTPPSFYALWIKKTNK